MFYSVSILSKKNGNLGYIWYPLRACCPADDHNPFLCPNKDCSQLRFNESNGVDEKGDQEGRRPAVLALTLPWNLHAQLPNPPQDNSRYFSVNGVSSPDKDFQQSSPFVANPKDISLHEEHTTPIETLQKQVEHPETEIGFGDESVIFMEEGPIASEVPVPAGRSVDVQGSTEKDAAIPFDETAKQSRPHSSAEVTPTRPVLHTPPWTIPQAQGEAFCSPLADQQLEEMQAEQVISRRVYKPRRKLMFDEEIRMPRDKLRQNLMTGDSTCRPAGILAVKVTPAKVLLAQPTCTISIKNKVFSSLWQRCVTKATESNQAKKGRDVANVSTEQSPLTTAQMPAQGVDASRLSHNPSESIGSEVEALRGSSRAEHSYHEQSGHSVALASSDTSENQSYDHMDTSSAHRADSNRPGRVPLPNMAGLSPIMDTDQEVDPMSMHIDFACDLSGSLDVSVSKASRTEASSFQSHVMKIMGARSEFEFQELLSENCTRKIASGMFAKILELITQGVLEPRQRQPYGPIILGRGEAF